MPGRCYSESPDSELSPLLSEPSDPLDPRTLRGMLSPSALGAASGVVCLLPLFSTFVPLSVVFSLRR